MGDQEYYSIGEVSKICNISRKALRFYDKIGIISPDKISDENNYRFYTKKTLLSVPIVKYFKQMGFKLEEMKEFLEGSSYAAHEKGFRKKIDELKELEREIHMQYTSVKDWYDLIMEAESVIESGVNEVAVKYLDMSNICFMEQDFAYSYMESIVNIEWTNYIEQIENAITGPVMIWFPSFRERMEGESKKIRILQQTISPCREDQTMKMGGYMVASCYHIGPHETINEAYEKICAWADEYGYHCAEESCERYVTDYWTTRKREEFVTEILIRVSRS